MIGDRLAYLNPKLAEASQLAIDAGITEEEITYLLYSNAVDFLINLFDISMIRAKAIREKSGK